MNTAAIVAPAQQLLAAQGYYSGAIDAIAGPKTRAGVDRVLGGAHRDWPAERRLVAAVQRLLAGLEYDTGPIDGWYGPQTTEALTAWLTRRAGLSSTVERAPLPARPDTTDLPRQRDVPAFYGRAGTAEIEARLTYANLPFDLRIDWNLTQTVRRIRVHELCAPSLEAALIAVRDHYGLDAMRRLGIDRYAGAYNPRRMRGGTNWSMHAYGCALDFYAAPNGLRTRCPDALFCGPDYAPFLDIMEAHGWLPAIRLWGADAMHFQRARL